jgi:hypothetical protein
MRKHFLWQVAVVLLASGPVAVAATVEPIAGKVSHSSGRGFQELNGPLLVAEGDIVMTGPDGDADIAFDNGCRQHIGPAQFVHVGTATACLDAAANSIDANTVTFAIPAVAAVAVGTAVLLKPASP